MIAQIFGFAAIGMSLLIYLRNTKKQILFCKLMQDVFWFTHYAILSCGSAAATQGLCITREIVFYNSDKKWAKRKIWVPVYMCLYLISAVLTWKSIFSIFPALSALFSTTALSMKKPLHTKLLMIPSSLCTLLYNLTVSHSPAVYIGITFTFTSITISIVHYLNVKRKEKKNTAQ